MSRIRLLRLLVSCALLGVASGAGAGVYKCMENGKLVYSDRRCAADSRPMDSNPSLSGTVDPRAKRYRYDTPSQRRRDLRRRSYGNEAKRGPKVIDQADPETVRRCNKIKNRRAQLAYSKRPRHVDEAEKLKELEFSECYGHVNGNQ